MDLSCAIALPRRIISFKVVTYALPCANASEVYFDGQAAVRFARAIDELVPRPTLVQMLYSLFDTTIRDRSDSAWTDQAYIDRLVPIIEPIRRELGLQLYRIRCESALQYLQLSSFEWQVIYQPGEEYDAVAYEVQQYIQSFTMPVQSLLASSLLSFEHSFMSAMPVQQLGVAPSTLPVEQHAAAVRSGFTTPADSPVAATPASSPSLLDALGLLMQEMDAQTPGSSSSARTPHFPTSQFTLAQTQRDLDNQAASVIVSKVKLLAVDPRTDSKHRFSLRHEKLAIRSMTIESSLNIGSRKWTMVERLTRLFARYDHVDEEERETFNRGLLLVVVRLLRHEFVHESGKKAPGNYASDFDKLYPFPDHFLRRANQLCRIIVACGHPCILVVLIRLCVRHRTSLACLLDALPVPHFCLWLATGKVCERNVEDERPHKDLLWLHSSVLLPLLHTASLRVPEQLCLVDGSLTCDEETCLRAIVHHSKQAKYSLFRLGHFTDADWERGKVLLDKQNIHGQTEPEYSIERKRRTFHKCRVASHAHTEHFADPPRFLTGQTLEMNLD